MRKYAVILLTVLIPAMVSIAEDRLYMNDGGYIKCSIVTSDSSSVTIRTKDGRDTTYSNSDIRIIYQESNNVGLDDSRRPVYPVFEQNDHGWWVSADIMSGATIESFNTMGMAQLTANVGYMFNEYIKIGIGAGARLYFCNTETTQRSSTWPKSWAAPLFASARGNFCSQKHRLAAPYWGLDIGYCINDGFMYIPTLGVKIGGMRGNLLLGVSYLGQMMSREVDGDIVNRHTSLLCGRVAYEF